MPVGKTTRGQSQKNLRQGKQREQHPDRRRAVALTQCEQGGGHAGACHTGVQANLGKNQAGQLRRHDE